MQKPLQPKELITLLEKYLPQRRQIIEQRNTLHTTTAEVLLGESPLIIKIRDQLKTIALTTKDVLIEGESDTAVGIL